MSFHVNKIFVTFKYFLSNAISFLPYFLFRSQADLIIKTTRDNTPRSTTAAVGTIEKKCINKSLSLQQINLADVHFNMVGCVPLSVAGDLVTTCNSPSFIFACNDGDLVSSLLRPIADSGHLGVEYFWFKEWSYETFMVHN